MEFQAGILFQIVTNYKHLALLKIKYWPKYDKGSYIKMEMEESGRVIAGRTFHKTKKSN